MIIFLIGVATQGLPSSNQITQTFLVAIFSGIIATTLFFYATNMVKHNQTKLAAVEATQIKIVARTGFIPINIKGESACVIRSTVSPIEIRL